MFPKTLDSKVRVYREAKRALREMMLKTNSFPIMLRLAWHDAGSFDQSKGLHLWPKCGGATGSIRFNKELDHPGSRGLLKAITLLEDVKYKFRTVTWADLIQMAGALSVELCGGPKIPIKFGRCDAKDFDDDSYNPSDLLPSATFPFPDRAPSAQVLTQQIRTTYHSIK